MLRKIFVNNFIIIITLLLIKPEYITSQIIEDQLEIVIKWNAKHVNGTINAYKGNIQGLRIKRGHGQIDSNHFSIKSESYIELIVSVNNYKIDIGPGSTIIHINRDTLPFSFFLRDVNMDDPIFIPTCSALVLMNSDSRSYETINNIINNKERLSIIEKIETEPESSFQKVKDLVRDMSAPIWLGMSRDMRMFEISEELEDTNQEAKIIKPKYATSYIDNPVNDAPYGYIYALGRGKGVENNISRYLEDGFLPVYNSELLDDDVLYHTTSFVTYGDGKLTKNSNNGTNYIISDKHSSGRVFKEEHLSELDQKMKNAYVFENTAVLISRTIIVNNGDVPRYAWVKTPRPGTGWWYRDIIHGYDVDFGISYYKSTGDVFCISKLNGYPLPNEEVSILIGPGDSVYYEFYMPHTPITPCKAKELINLSFDIKHDEVRNYWLSKLESGSNIDLPEERITDMIKAGLLHLDLLTFGENPDGVLAPNIGVYSPIGTESAPIIQFYLSMGWFDVAKRAIDYFFATQQDNGFIQNYQGYMVETGAALWTMGEYFRYTRDTMWVSNNKDKMIRACNYLINWRNNNKLDIYKGKGFGMISGKVADPEDPYHQFMLNGYGYLGIKRVAEILYSVDSLEASRLNKEADEWRLDIRSSLKNSIAKSPVIPMGDGTWTPTVPPWPDLYGPRALYSESETFWTHGTFTGIDALTGPMYLIFCEVLDVKEELSKVILDYHSELLYQNNTAFSQPYYSRHNWLQLRLGMTKPFLNTYYKTLAAHADRETYTFWEHMYRVSPHKTHEEAWFLMETRWMLFYEEEETLNLLSTIPREWLEDGKQIKLDNVCTYFGPISLLLKSFVDDGYIEAYVTSDDMTRLPRNIHLRVPHPDYAIPKKVNTGSYNTNNETIIINNFTGESNILIEF